MSTLNLQVIIKTCTWLEQGDRVFFITVINTWGASPRPVGSLLAYNLDKEIQAGSLSGGCIEDDLFDFLKHASSDRDLPTFFTKKYGSAETDSTRYLLPCGGTLELLIETIFDVSQHEHFFCLKNTLLARLPIARSLDLSDSRNIRYSLFDQDKIVGNEEFFYNNLTHEFYHRLDPAYRLLLVGGGDVTLYLSEFAETLGFDITICDPRAAHNKRFQIDQFAYKKHKPIYNISYDLPDDLIRQNFLDSFCAIVCLAHDPKVDDMALLEALANSNAFYIGAMGSLKTSQNRVSRLMALGLTQKQLSHLHAPIGLDIHSKTPQEIAIAISAELISSRYRHKLSSKSK